MNYGARAGTKYQTSAIFTPPGDTQTPFNIIYSLISWNSTLNYYNLYYIFDSVTSTDFSKPHDQLLRHLQLSQHHLLINL